MERTYLIPGENGWTLRQDEAIAVAALSWEKALKLATELGGQLVVESNDNTSSVQA